MTARSAPTTAGRARRSAGSRNRDGNVIAIDGLWALHPGNGTFASPRSIVFSAGIADEAHGLLGVIRSRR